MGFPLNGLMWPIDLLSEPKVNFILFEGILNAIVIETFSFFSILPLNHFILLVSFYTPYKHSGCLMFPGGRETDQLYKPV